MTTKGLDVTAAKNSVRSTPANDDHAWEKAEAPKVGRNKLIFVCCVYGAFTLFMAGLSIHRWFFSLQ